MNKKNLVFIIESLNLGGAEKTLVTLLQNLDYSNNNVSLILFNNNGLFLKFVPDKVNIIFQTNPSLSLFERIKYKLYRIRNKGQYHNAQLFWKIIQNKYQPLKEKYDIAIAYNQGFATYYTDKYIAASNKFAWLNTDYNKAGYNIKYDLPIYKRYNAIIAVSPSVKECLMSALKRANSDLPITIIKDFVDRNLILQQSSEKIATEFNKDRINIVTVGRLAKAKGLHLAIDSCRKLIEKGYSIQWYLIGEGGERSLLEQLIRKNHLETSFLLLGATDNPYPYIKACDIFVQTSLFEGLGTTLIEASYLCKPIVTTNFPSAFNIIEDEETGLICDMKSDDITDAIIRLIDNPSLREKFIDNLSKKENKDKEETLLKVERLFDDAN